MKNVLVTGGAGFMGSNFIRYLHRIDPDVKILNYDSLTYAGNVRNLYDLAQLSRYKYEKGDVKDSAFIHDCIHKYQIDTIVHFAAESHVDRSITDPRVFLDTNVLGTFVLLDAARKCDLRFHHISTDETFGTLAEGQEAWRETAPYGPRSPYSASKASADHFVRSFGNTYGLRFTISHGTNNYGPWQYPEKLIPLTIHNAINGMPITIHGDGLQVRDWINVEDHSSGVYRILKSGWVGETYNVGAEDRCSVLGIIQCVCKILDELRPIERPYSTMMSYVEDRTGQDRRYALNNEKLRSLGWVPKHKLNTSLKEVVRWYLENE